jgi:hypothetical protein
MKLRPNISARHRQSGVSLIECLAYIAVFAIMMTGATAAFYFCWDHTRAVIYTSNEIATALQAGESWRADVRAATGKISINNTASGQIVVIPEGDKEVLYRYTDGELRREIPVQNHSWLLLPQVKISEMTAAARSGVTAWRWELEIKPRRRETQLPLSFTFEAAQTKP